MARINKHILAVLTLGVLMVALAGCEKEGPAEKAGKEIDKAISGAETRIQSAAQELDSALK